MHPPTVSGVVPLAEMQGDDEEDTRLLEEAHQESRSFLLSQKWCFGVGEEFFGAGVGGVVAVFLMEIAPTSTDVDRWLWVVVGDMPSAYLVLDDAPTAIEALRVYIDLMREWVALASEGKSSKNVIPTGVSPTPENAQKLNSRLTALNDFVIPHLEAPRRT